MISGWLSKVGPQLGITIYGCGPDESALFEELAPGFGVVPTMTETALSEATVELATGNRCISISHKTPIANKTLAALADLGVGYISTRSIGFNHLDVRYAESVGICVGTITYSPDSVADFTMMLMLMSVRDAKSILRRTDLHDYRLHENRGRELRDLTVGVIGTGRIGTAVIQRLEGFGCRVLAYDKLRNTVSLDELIEQSDIVTLHTPLTAETHHLLDRRRIEQLKTDAYVINTGRGGLIDTEALVAALENDRLRGAALDVVEDEEGIFYTDCSDRPLLPTMRRLQRMPNVIVTPHTAYYTEHALRDTVESSIVNCLQFESRKREWI